MATPASHMWYVKAAGGVWGPYPETRVRTFIDEERVRADTPLSPWAQGPFAPASASSEFSKLLEARATRPTSAKPSAAENVLAGMRSVAETPIVARAANASAAPAHAAALRPLLIWADLSAGSTPAFHAALAALGSGVTIRPGLWLVQARVSAATLRNQLSRPLTGADALLVVEVPLDQAAWFNLDPGRDRDLRRLWGG